MTRCVMLSFTLDAEYDQQAMVVSRQHLAMFTVAKCCQLQTDDGRLFMSLSNSAVSYTHLTLPTILRV